MTGKNIFITGGLGFHGVHLMAKLLDRGDDVRIIDNFSHPCIMGINKFTHNNGSTATVDYGDIRYSSDLDAGINWSDIVVHLAAQINVDKSNKYPEETIDINIKGTLNVLEKARKYDKKVVFASSSEIYGTSETDTISEEHPLKPLSPYGVSKLTGDQLCRIFHALYGLDVSVVRNFNTFGPRQASDMYGAVISIFANRIIQGMSPVIFGTGLQERDYQFIEDAIQAYIIGIDKDFKGKPINFGTGKTVTIKEIATILLDEFSSKLEPIYAKPRIGEVQKLCANIAKARKLGFDPKYDFDEGIKEYVRWFKSTFHSANQQ